MKNVFAVIGFVAFALLAGLCVACNDGDDDESGWGFVGIGTVVAGDRDDRDEDNRSSRNKNGRDCRGSEDCSSFSPSFDKSPVEDSFNPTICLPFARCDDDSSAESPQSTTMRMTIGAF